MLILPLDSFIPYDPLLFSDWPQVAALLVIILGLILWKYLGELVKNTRDVKNTLTTNNGGSHVKDQFDRLESDVKSLTASVKTLEVSLGQHITWSEDYVKDNERKLKQLSIGRRIFFWH